MPRKIPDEEYEEEFGDEEEELGEDEEIEKPRKEERKLPPPPISKARKPFVKPVKPQELSKARVPKELRKRYTAFAQQATEGIVDAETQEIIATDIWTALANIIERLERIENSIGSMLEG